MQNEIVEILLTEEQIQNRIKELAAEINKEYAGKNPIFVGVLRGVVVFFSDFIRQFNDYCQIDFFDTGKSLDFTYHVLQAKHPASLKVVTLLDKPERRKPWVTLKPDYVGFTIPDKFVVGYGLDYNERFRNLPYIAVVDPNKTK